MLLFMVHQAQGVMSRTDLNNAFLASPSLKKGDHQKAKARVGKQICIDPALSAPVKPLMHKPQRGSSFSAPGEDADGCTN